MKQLWWLIVAVLCLVPLSLADSIDYSGAGSLSKGTAFVSGSLTAGSTWSVLDVLVEIDNLTTGKIQRGNLGSVDITTGTLSACAGGLCFTGGDLTIIEKSGLIFKDAFETGMVSMISGNVFLNAVMANGATVLLEDSNGNFSSDSTITVVTATTPETGSWIFMGTGFLGIGALGRRLRRAI